MFESYSKEVKEELHSCEHHARNLLRSCASYGSSRSLLQLARAHRKEGNPLWILYIQKAAEVGELPEAYIELGTCYQHGLGLEKNMGEAMRCFRLSGEIGKLRVRKLLQLGAEEGSIDAMMELSRISESEEGMDMDAARWLLQAAEQYGHIPAMLRLADHLDAGSGGIPNEDPKAAVMWLSRAAEAGNPEAMTRLANTFETGRGHAFADLERAFDWYRRASEEYSSAEASFALGMIFRRGIGVGGPDDEEAERWMRRAMDLGSEHPKEKLRRWGK